MLIVFQDGFLEYQNEPSSASLKYDVSNGMFQLSFESYAKIKCQMDFALYPFDTQRCTFVITPDKNLTYQGDSLTDINEHEVMSKYFAGIQYHHSAWNQC